MDNTNTRVAETIEITAVLSGDYAVKVELPRNPNNLYLVQEIVGRINDVQLPSSVTSLAIRNGDGLKLANNPNIALFDKDMVYINYDVDSAKTKTNADVCRQLGQDSEKLGPDDVTEGDINIEGIKFIRDDPLNTEGILKALSHKLYYLPQSFCVDYIFPHVPRQELPRLRVQSSPPLFVVSDNTYFIDYYENSYFEYMKAVVKLYNQKLFHANRNESHWQNSLYRALLSIASLHADVGGLEMLQIHKKILNERKFTSNLRNKFISGLKPDITDGWLLRYDDQKTPSLLTPDDKVIPGDLIQELKTYNFQLGDDMFLLVDLLMELKKTEVHDTDKYKVMLEAAGCLASFKVLVEEPVVFFGTGNCTHVRLYFARNSNAEEMKETIERSRSVSLSRDMEDISTGKKSLAKNREPSRSKETIHVHTIIKEMFSDRLTCLDSFLVFAVILWRLRVYRKRQFQVWLAKKVAALMKNEPKVTSAITQGTDREIPSRSPVKERRNEGKGTPESGKSTSTKQILESELLTVWNIRDEELFDETHEKCKILKCTASNNEPAMLKIDRRIKSITNEIRLYEYLTQSGFEGIPKLLNATLSDSYGAVLLSYVEHKQVFDVDTIDELIEYAYCLIKGIERLHSYGVIHGDLKPCNLFVGPADSAAPIIFIDFAFAQIVGANETFTSVRPALGYSGGYTSDETIKTSTVSLADDIYSAGVIIMTIACQADRKASYYDIDDAWEDFNLDKAPLCNDQIKDLVRKMTGPRKDRLPATALLQHNIFKQWSPIGSDEEMRID